MSRPKRNREDMFGDFDYIRTKVGLLSGIVQNEGTKPTDEDLQDWNDLVNDTLNQLNSLKEDVMRYYQD